MEQTSIGNIVITDDGPVDMTLRFKNESKGSSTRWKLTTSQLKNENVSLYDKKYYIIGKLMTAQRMIQGMDCFYSILKGQVNTTFIISKKKKTGI